MLMVVTSEESVLRGPAQLKRFLDRYTDGPTVYGWEWGRHDVSIQGPVAWLLAEGTATATSESGLKRHRYRMTMVRERREGGWLLMQVHGSAPH
jgi:hypothetical protein